MRNGHFKNYPIISFHKYFSNINSHFLIENFILFIHIVVFNFILTKQLYKLQLIKSIYQRVVALN